MSAKTRPYLFYDTTTSICTTCYRRVEAKILIQEQRVIMEKWCRHHGKQRVLLADDADYYRAAREQYLKKPEMPRRFQTPMRFGCPYDCGLCPDHMQHACLTLIEVTDKCNLRCPVCYAGSGPDRTTWRSMDEIEAMLDTAVACEGEPDVVQISGGEPTIHPDFWAILDAAKQRPIKHLMLNTNGLRIAREADFAARLASYQPGFEVYLQFDSLHDDVLLDLRGEPLRDIRLRAIERLNEADCSTTLVVTVKRGLNDDQLGEIIEFGLQQPCVRGITFQPIQAAGRLDNVDPERDRLTLTEVRRRILEQHELFKAGDLIPVPCNADALAMAYALKFDGKVTPLTGLIDRDVLVEGGKNSIVFEKDSAIRGAVFKLFATNHSPETGAASLRELLCCLPKIIKPGNLGYRNIFRVLIMQFIDAWSFDTRTVKKSCVHMATPDGKMIPFDTYNLFYRDGLQNRLEALRQEIEGEPTLTRV